MLSRHVDDKGRGSLPSSENIYDHTPKTDNDSHAASIPVPINPIAGAGAADISGSCVEFRDPPAPDNLDLGPSPLHLVGRGRDMEQHAEEPLSSPMPTSMPLPPFSLSTYLQLELSSNNVSPMYIHRSKSSKIPYEPSRVKIERLLDFLFLPPFLEQVLLFGTLACLDAFLFSFTILPLRFVKALFILAHSWGRHMVTEARFIGAFIYLGAGRMWTRKRSGSMSRNTSGTSKKHDLYHLHGDTMPMASRVSSSVEGISRSTDLSSSESSQVKGEASDGARPILQSMPSSLLPEQKADLLKGFLLILSCVILMYFDASRMYHGIRGQAAIKLYVIYNVLEVSHPS